MADISVPRSRNAESKKRKRDGKDKDRHSKRSRARGDDRAANGADGGRRHRTEGHTTEGSRRLKSRTETATELCTFTFEQEAQDGTDLQAFQTGWRVSKPLGGRMADIDPIVTDDEK